MKQKYFVWILWTFLCIFILVDIVSGAEKKKADESAKEADSALNCSFVCDQPKEFQDKLKKFQELHEEYKPVRKLVKKFTLSKWKKVMTGFVEITLDQVLHFFQGLKGNSTKKAQVKDEDKEDENENGSEDEESEQESEEAESEDKSDEAESRNKKKPKPGKSGKKKPKPGKTGKKKPKSGKKGKKKAEKGDQSMKDCSAVMKKQKSSGQKKQLINPFGNATKVEVLCDFDADGGGWTFIQKRSSGPKEDFNRGWKDYVDGFGSVENNFWVGLQRIRAFTKNGDQELRIDLEDWDGVKKFAKYSKFSVADASDFYRLSIDGYSPDSTLKDDMKYPYKYFDQNGMQFSTKDKDNDQNPTSCAVAFGGGWWFNSCGPAFLNGRYFQKGETVPGGSGITWASWKGSEYSMKKAEMKIRKRK